MTRRSLSLSLPLSLPSHGCGVLTGPRRAVLAGLQQVNGRPTADGTADQVMKTDGSGNITFGEVSGGEQWQTVKTSDFTAVAGEGYFINTTSAVVTMTLPASPSLGDFVTFVDYAGTFDTNALTIGRNSQPIQGSASDLTVSVERASNTLVYVDGTQGWLLKAK